MKRALPFLLGFLLAGWLGYQLNDWVSCKARGGEWLRSPMTGYECRGAK